MGTFFVIEKTFGFQYYIKNAPQGCTRFSIGILSLIATQKWRRISRAIFFFYNLIITPQAIFVPEATFKDTEKLKALLENYKKDLRFPETMEIHDADTPANSKKIYSIFLNQ